MHGSNGHDVQRMYPKIRFSELLMFSNNVFHMHGAALGGRYCRGGGTRARCKIKLPKMFVVAGRWTNCLKNVVYKNVWTQSGLHDGCKPHQPLMHAVCINASQNYVSRHNADMRQSRQVNAQTTSAATRLKNGRRCARGMASFGCIHNNPSSGLKKEKNN